MDYINGEEGNGCKLLSTEYKGNEAKLLIQCRCGKPFEVSFHNFKSRNQKQCPDCGGKIRAEKQRNNIKTIKNYINGEEGNGCKLLSTEYKNARTKLKIQCACGEIFEKTFNNFKDQNQKQCPKCSNEKVHEKQRNNIKIIKNYIEGKEGNGCKLLSTEYKNNKTPLKIQCACGEIFEVNFNNFQNGQKQCSKCGITRRSGENNPMNRPELREMVSKRQKELWRNEEYRSHHCGENNPHWNPNLTDEERKKKRNIEGYSEWREDVYERDNYTCQCCGNNKGGNLNAHHLNCYHYDKEHRIDINNGITLCEDCHKEFHKIYGYGNNTIAQFREFLFNKYTQSHDLKFLALIENIDLTTRAF